MPGWWGLGGCACCAKGGFAGGREPRGLTPYAWSARDTDQVGRCGASQTRVGKPRRCGDLPDDRYVQTIQLIFIAVVAGSARQIWSQFGIQKDALRWAR